MSAIIDQLSAHPRLSRAELTQDDGGPTIWAVVDSGVWVRLPVTPEVLTDCDCLIELALVTAGGYVEAVS